MAVVVVGVVAAELVAWLDEALVLSLALVVVCAALVVVCAALVDRSVLARVAVSELAALLERVAAPFVVVERTPVAEPVVELVTVVVLEWPWKPSAAITASAPESATAAATTPRVIALIRRRPASRARIARRRASSAWLGPGREAPVRASLGSFRSIPLIGARLSGRSPRPR